MSDAFEEIMFGLEENVRDALSKQVLPMRPSVLYHYTNSKAAIDILQNKKLWASDVRMMNDSSELEYAKSLALNTLEFYKEEAGHQSEYKYLKETFEHLPRHEPEQVFVSCFSSDPNILSQWRNYSDNGKGICIGFDTDMLIKVLKEQYLHNVTTLQPVFYEKGPLSNILKVVVGTHLDTFRVREQDLSKYDNYLGLLSSFLCPHIVMCYPSVKHHAFHEEFEWRISCSPFTGQAKHTGKEYIKFRPSVHGITPYIEIDIEKHANDGLIKEIHIGPATNDNVTKYGVEKLLEVEGYKSKICLSELPFR